VSGSLAAQAAREQLPTAATDAPDLVTIWLAVNDLNASVPDKDYSVALRTIVDGLVKGTSARIFMGNVPDLRAVPAYAGVDPSLLIGRVLAYNEVIRVIAAQNADRVVVVDLFTGSAELMTQVTVASDGFHPSDAGYALIAQRFADAMRKAGVPLR
jgi:acyl-CoA thioesterase I